MDSSSLTALVIFENTLNKELVRSVHVYRLEDGKEKEVEREFIFCVHGPYVEMAADPILITRRLRVLELFEGEVIGMWHCIFAFHAKNPRSPSLLSLSRNPKLKTIPALGKDIQFIFKSIPKVEDEELSQSSSKEMCEGSRNDDLQSKKNLPVLDQDLNCLPYSIPTAEASPNEEIEQSATGAAEKKKKRAAAEDIAQIALEDLVQYFGLPIVEASRKLNVGLTVLKRKCRELGIPRWPHRKIKSLDSLIHNLQEEAERQKQDNEDAAMAVAKRRSMLEREKETIEKKPFIEIQSETRRFRQDVFKRRHRARARRSQGLSLES